MVCAAVPGSAPASPPTVAATAGNGPVHACGSTGAAVDVPDKLGKRDSTGTKLRKPVAAVCAAPQ